MEVFWLSWHEQLELLYFRRGGAAVFVGTSRTVAQDGDLYIINPLEFHTVRHSGSGACAVYDCIMIERKVYHELLRELCLLKYGAPMPDQNVIFNSIYRAGGELAFFLDAIIKEFNGKGFASDIVIEKFTQNLIIELFRTEHIEFRSVKDSDWQLLVYQRLEPALAYLEKHYTEPIRLDELAALCAVTKSYFCRLFKTATKQTVTEYINAWRMSLAEQLLRSTNMPIAEVARQAGFDDNCYFSRKFKKEFGVSPKKIR